MRAVAVLLVLLYHGGLPVTAGYVGVDVFFVISGFLITGLLLRELEETGSIAWPRFLARRVRRLLPAAVLVLVFTAAVSYVVIPGTRRNGVGSDVVAAATYVVNWLFADRSVDYLAADMRPSPIQHYWSLSVEEQFYLFWPLALAGLALLARRVPMLSASGRPRRAVIGGLLAAIAVPSFGYAVHLSRVDPGPAYFVTTTRAWELGIGAGLACWLAVDPRAGVGGSVPAGVRAVIGWLGLVAVIGSAFVIPETRDWPSWWTLPPTLGTAGVIWAGSAPPGAARGPIRVLGLRPMLVVGALSYSLYLWHWPVLVLTEWAHDDLLPTTAKCAVVAASAIPAYLSHRFVERPIHHGPLLARNSRVALAFGLAGSLAASAAAVPLLDADSPFTGRPPPGVDAASLGAATLGVAPSTDPAAYRVDRWDWLVPDPMVAGTDRPDADVDRCQVDRKAVEPVACTFGEPGGRIDVALVGDSKAMQWLPALQREAGRRGYRITTFGKSLCPFTEAPASIEGSEYAECDAFNAAVLTRLLARPPDVVVTSSAAREAWGNGAPSRAALVAGLTRRWTLLRDRGIPVVVIADNPSSPDDLDVCAGRHPRQLTRCTYDRGVAVAASGASLQREAAARSGATFVDLTPWLCPVRSCPVAIGNVTVNRAGDHVTATYAASLSPQVSDGVARGLASAPAGGGRKPSG